MFIEICSWEIVKKSKKKKTLQTRRVLIDLFLGFKSLL